MDWTLSFFIRTYGMDKESVPPMMVKNLSLLFALVHYHHHIDGLQWRPIEKNALHFQVSNWWVCHNLITFCPDPKLKTYSSVMWSFTVFELLTNDLKTWVARNWGYFHYFSLTFKVLHSILLAGFIRKFPCQSVSHAMIIVSKQHKKFVQGLSECFDAWWKDMAD